MSEDAYFDPVDPRIDFSSNEKRLLDKWKSEDLYQKYLNKNKTSKKYFSFLDGPITANNPMGVHHGWGRTYKDIFQRFYNLKGFKERFQNGFDCQGLWVEVEVEKELGLKSKKDIENLVPGDKKASIAKFVDLCKERVAKYSKIQALQSIRLGYFMDWDHSYYTLSEANNYMIWHFLKVCHENGWVYKGSDVVPWCRRCETAISQHEILTEDYKEVTHDSVYFRLPVIGKRHEYLLVWTTTPWTIPANTAVAVDAKLDYVLVENKEDKNNYWIVSDLAESIFGKGYREVKKIKGKDLVGLKYASPFDDLPYISKIDNPLFHTVIATDPLIMPITTVEGTGMVHTSTSTGEEDHKLGKKKGLPVSPAVDDLGNYLESMGYLANKNAKEDPNIIFEILKEKEFLFKILPYTHRYPACWRCKAELIWKLTDEWYIAMDKKGKNGKTLRERMIKVAKSIKWLPEFGMARELDWLKNMHDWLISKKNRYWGLALPIWECNKCGHFEVVGGKEELKSKVVSGWENFEGKTPHKPQIDELKIKCSKCGETVSRIEPVGNPWLDAGIVPFSTISSDNTEPLYLKDREEWLKWFPANFITEGFAGQFKNWFYALIAMSTVLEDMKPFETVLGHGTVVAEDGRPMHKSWGNSIEFNEAADKMGTDVMRWIYSKANYADDLPFGFTRGDEVRRLFLLKLWNIYNFFVTYANIDKFRPKDKQDEKPPNNLLDQWILSRLNSTIVAVSEALSIYKSSDAASTLETFVDDFSNWYIRLSRSRVGPASEDKESRESFYNTTYNVLTKLMTVLSVFMPFITDEIYTNLTKKDSVHLSSWPEVKPGNESQEKMFVVMSIIRDYAEKIHALRKTQNVALKQPLVKVVLPKQTKDEIEEKYLDLLKAEVNVLKVEFKSSGDIEIDATITPEIEEELKLRELIRKIQNERKSMGLNLNQKTLVTNDWVPEKPEALSKLLKKTSTKKIEKGDFGVKLA